MTTIASRAANGPVISAVLKIAVPLAAQQLMFSLQGLINQAFLGHVDVLYLTIVSGINFPFFGFSTFLQVIGTGSTILVSQNKGAGNLRAASATVENSYLASLGIGLALAVLWFLAGGIVSNGLGLTGSYRELGREYAEILAVNYLFIASDSSLSSYLVGTGKTRPIFVAALARVILNIALDWILIFGKFGFPAMGVHGAAVATVTATGVASLVLLAGVRRKKRSDWGVSLSRIHRPDLSRLWVIVRLGTPASLESMAWFVGFITLQRLIGGVGPAAVGVFGLVVGLQFIPTLIHQALGIGAGSLIGQRVGSGDLHGARHVGLVGIYAVSAVSLAVGLVFVFFPEQVLSVFTDDQNIVHGSSVYLWVDAAYFLLGGGNIMTGAGIRSRGDTKWMLWTQLFGTLLVIGAAILYIGPLGLGLLGAFLALLTDEAVRLVLNVSRFFGPAALRAQSVVEKRPTEDSPEI